MLIYIYLQIIILTKIFIATKYLYYYLFLLLNKVLLTKFLGLLQLMKFQYIIYKYSNFLRCQFAFFKQYDKN